MSFFINLFFINFFFINNKLIIIVYIRSCKIVVGVDFVNKIILNCSIPFLCIFKSHCNDFYVIACYNRIVLTNM